ncbi:MAG TPA: hypothetical protein VMB72_02430 [Acidimicrobiales bacterium]|nr:hypothetical protein [Acidimicrobiales bacterium]
MTHDTHDDHGATRAFRRGRVVGAVGAALLAVAVLGTACGTGGDGPGVASAGAAATTTTSDPATGSSGAGSGPSPKEQAQLLKFSQCMRAHGINDFPDPSGGGIELRGGPGTDLDPQNPKFRAAQAACAKDMPGADLTPAQKATANAKALKFAQCMRAHGEPDFPDPDGQGVIRITNGSGVLDPNAPQFQQAQKACQSLSGGFQMQVTAGGPGPAGGSGPGPVSLGNS